MKVALMKDAGHVKLEDRALRPIEAAEILLRIDACGICGSDRTTAIDGRADYLPFGHEIAGTILEAGGAAEWLNPGQPVVLDSSTACGHCAMCKDARQEECLSLESFFHRPYLGFGEQMISPAISAVPYDRISAEQACLAEPLGVALDMAALAEIHVGSHVVVSGLGTIGLMALRLAKLAGAERIYAVGTSRGSRKAEVALSFGADEFIAVDKTPLDNYPFAQPPDRFLVCSPPRSIPAMFKAAAKAAIISFVGIRYGEGANITFDLNEFHFKKLQLRASYAAPAMRTPEAVRLLSGGGVDGGALVTHVFELGDIAEAVRVAVDDPDAIKVVVVNKNGSKS